MICGAVKRLDQRGQPGTGAATVTQPGIASDCRRAVQSRYRWRGRDSTSVEAATVGDVVSLGSCVALCAARPAGANGPRGVTGRDIDSSSAWDGLRAPTPLAARPVEGPPPARLRAESREPRAGVGGEPASSHQQPSVHPPARRALGQARPPRRDDRSWVTAMVPIVASPPRRNDAGRGEVESGKR